MGISIRTASQDNPYKPDNIVANSPDSIVIVNDIPDSKDSLDKLKSLIYRAVEDEIDHRPSCDCGHLKELAILKYTDKDTLCEICNTPVSSLHNRDLKPFIFIRRPRGVRKLLDIKTVYQLNKIFTIIDRKKSGKARTFELFRWLIDTKQLNSHPEIIQDIRDLGITGRGYNYFIDNFTDIISALSGYRSFTSKLDVKNKSLLKLWDKERDLLLSDTLYMLNRDIIVMEATSDKRSSMRTNLSNVFTVVRMFTGIDDKYEKDEGIKTKQQVTAAGLIRLAEFYYKEYNEFLPRKKGLIKAHVAGCKSSISMRVVTVSGARDIKHDEIFLPYAPTVQMMKYYIMSKFRKQGYEMQSIYRYIDSHTTKFSQKIYDILLELIEESPWKGLPCIVQRYPTLAKPNFALAFATKVKPNASDLAVTSPLISSPGSNRDYDGDALVVSYIQDTNVAEDMINSMAHHKSYVNILGSSLELHRFLSLPSTVSINSYNWLIDKNSLKRSPKALSKIASKYS